ncbi:MAG: diphosphate--fructose-6-phosphate 1-phosphotransferase, partial [Oscillospiraceae bacterium]|nr:diphosphate--fructose-6-phosphate 1-phosphotransferase [Oscillospiraceae bacterium]
MKKNIIVGQSGGPTAAINATLAGVIRGASADENIEKIYGMVNGIQGLLEGNVRVLNGIFDDEMNPKLLRNTPAAALGSCRLRLPDVDSNNQDDIEKYIKIFSFLEEKNIKYFLYIGGNDSMDTVQKLSCYAERNNIEVKIIGTPKTVDNDLVGTDHTPGFGSAAKYTATTLHEICHDNEIYDMKSIVIVEIMGRDAGWLTASAALPRLYGWKAPNLVYLPEIEFSDERFVADIEKEFGKRNDIVIAVSEGLKYSNGKYVCENIEHETDIFGHKQLSGTADCLKYIAKERFGCKVRAVELNTPQR